MDRGGARWKVEPCRDDGHAEKPARVEREAALRTDRSIEEARDRRSDGARQVELDGVERVRGHQVVRTDEAEVPPVITDDLGVSRWRLDQAGLYFLSGEGLSQTVPLSLALFNAEESALTRAPVTAS